MKWNRKRGRVAAAFVGVLAAVFVLAGCGGGSSGSSDPNTLNVLTWETYHNKAWLDEFTKATGIHVNAVNVGSADEMFAKVKSAPGQWDVALVTAGWFDNYAKAGLLQQIDQ